MSVRNDENGLLADLMFVTAGAGSGSALALVALLAAGAHRTATHIAAAVMALFGVATLLIVLLDIRQHYPKRREPPASG